MKLAIGGAGSNLWLDDDAPSVAMSAVVGDWTRRASFVSWLGAVEEPKNQYRDDELDRLRVALRGAEERCRVFETAAVERLEVLQRAAAERAPLEARLAEAENAAAERLVLLERVAEESDRVALRVRETEKAAAERLALLEEMSERCAAAETELKHLRESLALRDRRITDLERALDRVGGAASSQPEGGPVDGDEGRLR